MTKRSVFCWLALAALVTMALPPQHSLHVFAAGQPKTLPGTVPAAVTSGSARLIGPHRSDDTIHLAVVLTLQNSAALQTFLQQIHDPSSPRYRRPLSQDAANASFNPTPDEEQSVSSWLGSAGLTVTQTYPNHLLVDASGTVGQVEKLLGITLNDYKISIQGVERTFFAPNADPVVDALVATAVATIVGLDSYPRFHMASNGSAHGYPAYYPQDFANAYDVNQLWAAGANGGGQHIGITLWTVPPADATLAHFAAVTAASVARTGNGRLKIIPVDGGTTAAISPDTGEAGMDIESSSGVAPGATIDYYEAPTDNLGNPTGQGLLDALNQAATDTNRNLQITNSWGECEYSNDAWTRAAESIFAVNAATGHSYFFSSGDNGSWCAPDGVHGQDPYPDYPASSPNVTSIGGTAFSGNINGGYPGESAWAYCRTCNGGNPEGSGGGYSNIFARPSWQVGNGLASNGMRGYPDISADADPSTGAFVCYGASQRCGQFGGTSLSSPLWAGITADINSYLATRGQPPVGFLAPTLYSLANSTQTYPEFHDITVGTNGSYNAGINWDAVTGWGTMDAYNLAQDIAASGGGGGGATPTATSTNAPTPAATDTPTATATSTPTPTATPTGRQVVANGGFESGLAPWMQSSANGHQIVSTLLPHTGTHSAYFCNTNSCNDQIWQTVSIPGTFTHLVLSYWYYISTQEVSFYCYDAFHSRIRTTAAYTIVGVQNLCNYNKTNGWVQKTVDLTSSLSAYQGKQVQIYFQGTTNATNPTRFVVDDVSLVAS